VFLVRNGTHQRRRSPVSREELDAVFHSAARDPRAIGARDAAIIAMVCGSGLRARDIAALRIDHVDLIESAVTVTRDCCTLKLSLPPFANDALQRWLVFRGNSPGHLINPIARPARVLLKAVSPSMVNDTLLRRSVEAGVSLFTADDAVRTAWIVATGRWHGARCIDNHGGHSVFTPPDIRGQNPSQELLIRFLSRFGYAHRTALLGRLNRLAWLLTEGAQNAFEFDWTSLDARRLPPLDPVTSGCNLRTLSKLKDALHGVLREGVVAGIVDQGTYIGVVQQKWSKI
jgi:hypothetical protein